LDGKFYGGTISVFSHNPVTTCDKKESIRGKKKKSETIGGKKVLNPKKKKKKKRGKTTKLIFGD
jgi:hypothetical protein